jgi:pimeloyl-ACP methyl ester carboxylesterase
MGTHEITFARLRSVRELLGQEVARNIGIFPLDAFDAGKRPILMIHGLGSNALAWSQLTTRIRNDPALGAAFQVWHVRYHASAPMIVVRRRVERYLDAMWQTLDPGGRAPARAGMVLIGHSLGGVVARMLCVESGETLWSTAFTEPAETMLANAARALDIGNVFRFRPYPGVSRAIFLGAPHRGSPNADRWLGRLFRLLIGGRTTEIRNLRRFARDHPDKVQPALRALYQHARSNSVASLQTLQPIRLAGESLMPVEGIPYHVIAAVLQGCDPPGDGAVPLRSALLPGAASTRVVKWGHDLCNCDEAIDEVLRILREDLSERRNALPASSAPAFSEQRLLATGARPPEE